MPAAIFDADYTAAGIVRDLVDHLENRGVGVLFARANAYLRAYLAKHGISAAVGEERIFETLHEAIAAMRSGGPLAGSEGTQAPVAP